jgi:hypothetical protein
MSLAHIEAGLALPERVTLEGQLALWRDVAEFANHIAATEFVPKDLRNKPASVAAAMLRANELGISPMQGLAQIHVINGRPGLAAELMRALVLSHGHDIWTEETTQSSVTVCGKRTGSDHVEKVTWTLDDAKRAKLDGKDVWRQYPRSMLLARATAELCRLRFADVLAGMSYAVEELEDLPAEAELPVERVDDEPDPPKRQTRKATGTAKKAARRRAPALPAGAPPEPPLPGEDDDAIDTTATDDPDELVTKRAQQIAIKAGEADVDHHQVVAAVTGGLKHSAKQVTAEEASQVIAALHDIRDGRARLELDDKLWRIVAVEPDDDHVEVDEFEWSSDQWNEFLAEHGVKRPDLLREANRWCTEHQEAAPSKLDDLRDRDELCVHLRAWVEEKS